MWADWTDRIAGGELPAAAPARPQGRERNVVVTMWDWADPKAYLHDEIASDKRNPTVNANGPIYGALEDSADYMPVVDPKTHAATQIKLTVRDPEDAERGEHAAGAARRRTGARRRSGPARPTRTASRWTSRRACGLPRASVRIRPSDFCKQGSTHPSAKAFPIAQSGRQMQMYDPKTKTGHDDRHLLRHAPSELRRQRRAVVHRRRPGRGLVRHAHLRQDQGRAEGAGLDGVRARHQRQRQARRVRRARSADRSDEGQAHQRAVLRRGADARSTTRSGDRCRACPDRSCA